MKRDAESDIDKWMLKKATADVGRKRASSPSAAEERFGAYAFAPRHPREHLFCVSIPCPPTPLRSPASARAPPDGRNPDGRRVGGIRKSYATSGRTDGQTEEPTAERASERASNRAPTTHNAEAGSVVVASCRHPRSPHRRARILLPPPPRRRRRRHAESLLLAGRLDANVGGRKVVKGCSSLPCPLRDLAPSFLLSCPPSFHLLPRGCLTMPRGVRGAAVAAGEGGRGGEK